jgi:hypothetical protein
MLGLVDCIVVAVVVVVHTPVIPEPGRKTKAITRIAATELAPIVRNL